MFTWGVPLKDSFLIYVLKMVLFLPPHLNPMSLTSHANKISLDFPATLWIQSPLQVLFHLLSPLTKEHNVIIVIIIVHKDSLLTSSVNLMLQTRRGSEPFPDVIPPSPWIQLPLLLSRCSHTCPAPPSHTSLLLLYEFWPSLYFASTFSRQTLHLQCSFLAWSHNAAYQTSPPFLTWLQQLFHISSWYGNNFIPL